MVDISFIHLHKCNCIKLIRFCIFNDNYHTSVWIKWQLNICIFVTFEHRNLVWIVSVWRFYMSILILNCNSQFIFFDDFFFYKERGPWVDLILLDPSCFACSQQIKGNLRPFAGPPERLANWILLLFIRASKGRKIEFVPSSKERKKFPLSIWCSNYRISFPAKGIFNFRRSSTVFFIKGT